MDKSKRTGNPGKKTQNGCGMPSLYSTISAFIVLLSPHEGDVVIRTLLGLNPPRKIGTVPPSVGLEQ